MSVQSVTHCPACRAVMNPAWTACFVCGKPESAAASEGKGTDLASRILSMDCETFKAAHATVEIKVPWDAKPLFFVSDETLAAPLTREGTNRGRIWTANELLDLLAIPGVTREQVKKVATAKAIFAGTVTA